MDGLNASTISVLVKIASDTKGLKQAQQALEQYQAKVKEGAGIVAGAFTIAGAAVVAGAAVSLKAASSFQASMEMIRTQAGATQKEVDTMSNALLQLAPKVGMGPAELATGLYHLESAGFRGAQALSLLTAAAKGAQMGQANLEDTTQALISLTASHIKGVKNASQAMGILNSIVGSGDMRMEGLAQAMSTGVVPSAASFGLSIQDVGAALATLTDNAVPPIDAATRLRMTFSMLAAPSSTAAKEFAKLGLSATQLADDMRNKGLLVALEDLKKHLDSAQVSSVAVSSKMTKQAAAAANAAYGVSQAQLKIKILGEANDKAALKADKHTLALNAANHALAHYKGTMGGAITTIQKVGGAALTASEKADILARAFGGGRSSSAILTLMEQMDRLKSKYADINNGAKNFGSSWAATQQTAAFATQRFTASISALTIEFGQKLLPIYSKIVGYIGSNLVPAIDTISKFFEKNKLAAAALGGILTGAVVLGLIAVAIAAAPAIAAVGAFLATFGPIGIAVAAVATVIILYWKQISTATQKFVKDHIDFFNNLWTTTKAVFAFGLGFIQALWKTVWGGLKQFITGWWEELKGLFLVNFGALEVVFAVFEGILTGNWKKAWTDMQKGFEDIWGGIVSFLKGALDLAVGFIESAVNVIIGIINGLIGGINKVGSAVPGIKTNLPTIPSLSISMPSSSNASSAPTFSKNTSSSSIIINNTNHFSGDNGGQMLLNNINYNLATVGG